MDPEVDRLVRSAIAERRLVRFQLDGLPREGEIHDYGELHGEDRILVFQLRGQSHSGGLPNWRLVTLARASRFELLAEPFKGTRAVAGKHQPWSRLYASVSREPFG